MAEFLKEGKKKKFEEKSEIFKKEINRNGKFDMLKFDQPYPMPID